MKLGNITFEMVQKAHSSTKVMDQIYTEVAKYANYITCQYLLKEDAMTREDVAYNAVNKIIIKMKDQYSPEYKFSTWVHKIIKNTIIDFTRERKLNTTSLSTGRTNEFGENFTLDVEDTSCNIDTKMKNKEIVDFAQKLIDSDIFNVQQKTIMIMRFIDDKSYNEIVEETGLKLNTVKGIIHRVMVVAKKNVNKKSLKQILFV
jgi:RNA polymerase sigma-70 factor (ECF subfamily)